MAHNLEYNLQRGTTSFFSRKELAWHGLGQVIQEAVSPEHALKLANLDYTVELKPIYASFIPKGTRVIGKEPYLEAIDLKTGQHVMNLTKKGALIPTHKSICRMDTNTPLAVVGNRYTPVQNSASLDFIYNILKLNPDIKERNDIIIETAGALGQGERIFVTAKLPKDFKVGEEKDSTELYVVFTNSHDGTSSLVAMVTPIRVVCNNTLTAAFRNNVYKVSFRHTAGIHDNLTEGSKLLHISYQSFERQQEIYNALNNIKVDVEMVKDLIFKSMLPNDKYLPVKNLNFKDIPDTLVSTRMINQINDIGNWIDMGVGQNTNRGTAYWAYMGINSYINNGVNYKDYDAKFNSLVDGTNYKLDTRVLNNVMDLI